jgi:hypothetical protein
MALFALCACGGPGGIVAVGFFAGLHVFRNKEHSISTTD